MNIAKEKEIYDNVRFSIARDAKLLGRERGETRTKFGGELSKRSRFNGMMAKFTTVPSSSRDRSLFYKVTCSNICIGCLS